MARKRKTLPKNFGDMLEAASLDDLKAVFDACELEATSGYNKDTALHFYRCPDELARWLVERGANVNATNHYGRTPLHERSSSWIGGVETLLDLGADIEARDRYGDTPLHKAAQSHKSKPARVLVARGANIHAQNERGLTPLGLTLQTARNIDIVETAAIAELLLAAGDPINDAMRKAVERIGHDFEWSRDGFNPEYLEATDAGLTTLYRLFEVAPAPCRQLHDGQSPITTSVRRDWPALA